VRAAAKAAAELLKSFPAKAGRPANDVIVILVESSRSGSQDRAFGRGLAPTPLGRTGRGLSHLTRRRSAATRKTANKKTEDGLPVSSFRDLIDALATLCQNRIRLRGSQASFDQLTRHNNLQRRALQPLELNPTRL
jgi:hypothetical protein